MVCKLWDDIDGGVITSALVLVASVTVGILLAGMTSLRSGLLGEYDALEKAIKSQSLSGTLHSDTDSQLQGSFPTSPNYVQVFDPEMFEDQ